MPSRRRLPPPSGLTLDFSVPLASPAALMTLPSLRSVLLASNPMDRTAEEFALLRLVAVEGPGLATGAAGGFAAETIRLGFFRAPETGAVVEAITRPGPVGRSLFVSQLVAPGLEDPLLRTPVEFPDFDLDAIRDCTISGLGRCFLAHRPDAVAVHTLIAAPALDAPTRRLLMGAPAGWVSGLFSPAEGCALVSLHSAVDGRLAFAAERTMVTPVELVALYPGEVNIRGVILALKILAGAIALALTAPANFTLVAGAVWVCGLIAYFLAVIRQALTIANLLFPNNPQVSKLMRDVEDLAAENQALRGRVESLERQIADGKPVQQATVDQALGEVRDALRKLDDILREGSETLDPDSRSTFRKVRSALDGELDRLRGTGLEPLIPPR